MLRLELKERIYEAASRGLLRAYTTSIGMKHRHVVVVPERNWFFLSNPVHCDEYGFYVGYRKERLWYDPFGIRYDEKPAVLLDTAMHLGLIIERRLKDRGPYPTLAERIIEAEYAGLFSPIWVKNREYGVILSRQAFFRYTLHPDDFTRYGEPIAVRNSRGKWESMSGYLLSEVAPEVQQ